MAVTGLRDWGSLAERRLRGVVRRAWTVPGLRALAPSPVTWRVGVRVVSGPQMRKLNYRYRKKNYTTDVLSFPAPEPFYSQGWIGELVVCIPVLKAQARELGHSERRELEVLLAHGLLHLLGLDHEKSRAEARKMARLEARLLGRAMGLIGRTK